MLRLGSRFRANSKARGENAIPRKSVKRKKVAGACT